MRMNIRSHICMCTICMPGLMEAGRGIELNQPELHIVVSQHVDAANQTWVLCSNSQCSATSLGSYNLVLNVTTTLLV